MATEQILYSANYFEPQEPSPTREKMAAMLVESDERIGRLLDSCALFEDVSQERGDVTRRAILLCGRLAAELGTSLSILQNEEDRHLIVALSCPFFLFSGKPAGELANLAIGASEIEVYTEEENVVLRALFSFAPDGEPLVHRFFDAIDTPLL